MKIFYRFWRAYVRGVRVRRASGIGRSRLMYKTTKEQARALVRELIARLEARATEMQLTETHRFIYGRIAIKNHKSRWGSCSKKGNLNFNYRIVALPRHLAEYIVAHELCHLLELNHSPRFWHLVGAMFPDYKKLRAELKAYH